MNEEAIQMDRSVKDTAVVVTDTNKSDHQATHILIDEY